MEVHQLAVAVAGAAHDRFEFRSKRAKWLLQEENIYSFSFEGSISVVNFLCNDLIAFYNANKVNAMCARTVK